MFAGLLLLESANRSQKDPQPESVGLGLHWIGAKELLFWAEYVIQFMLAPLALAHLWFVTIHPFDDGNGRIARAIADRCFWWQSGFMLWAGLSSPAPHSDGVSMPWAPIPLWRVWQG